METCSNTDPFGDTKCQIWWYMETCSNTDPFGVTKSRPQGYQFIFISFQFKFCKKAKFKPEPVSVKVKPGSKNHHSAEIKKTSKGQVISVN